MMSIKSLITCLPVLAGWPMAVTLAKLPNNIFPNSIPALQSSNASQQALLALGWNSMGAGLNSDVSAIVIDGADVYVGGNFTDAGGIPEADYIARWDGSSWHAVGAGLTGAVRSIAIQGSNIYVGGQFLNAGGNPNADRIAYWNGTSWNPVGTGLNGTVWALAISGANIYAGGDFTLAGGVAGASYIARWSGSSWNALGPGLNSFVLAIAINGADVYAAGGFTNAGGNTDADGIARWNGTSWNSLGTGGMNFWAACIAISGTNIFVGGGFTDAGGNPSADYIARFDGTSWHALGSGTGGPVYALAAEGGGVYAGGNFFNAGGNPNADFIAYWSGSSWGPLGNAINSGVKALAILDNNVFAGGDFIDAGGDPNLDYVGRWENVAAPVELGQFSASPENKSVRLRWNTYSESGNHYFQVEHSTDGQIFRPIGRVPGNGNSTQIRQYTYLHDSPAPGNNYYRLRQVDYDGSEHFSPVTSIRFTAPFLQLSANPVSEQVALLGAGEAPLWLRLFSTAGTLLKEQAYTAGETLDLRGLTPGVYVLQVQDGINIQSFRIVRE